MTLKEFKTNLELLNVSAKLEFDPLEGKVWRGKRVIHIEYSETLGFWYTTVRSFGGEFKSARRHMSEAMCMKYIIHMYNGDAEVQVPTWRSLGVTSGVVHAKSDACQR